MVPLALVFVVTPLLIFAQKDRLAAIRRAPWIFLSVPASSLIFWFLTAPEHRFAGAAFWILGAGAVALALRAAERSLLLAVVGSIEVVLLANNVDAFEFLRQWHKDIRPVAQGPVIERVTDSGLKVFVPAEGDLGWNAPLPCTPYFDARLRARTPGDLRGGFVLDTGRTTPGSADGKSETQP